MGTHDASAGHDQLSAGDPAHRGTGVHHQSEGGSNQRGLAGRGGSLIVRGGPTAVPARVLKATPAVARHPRQARGSRRRTKAAARPIAKSPATETHSAAKALRYPSYLRELRNLAELANQHHLSRRVRLRIIEGWTIMAADLRRVLLTKPARNPAVVAAWPDYKRGVRGKPLFQHIPGYNRIRSRWRRQQEERRLLVALRKRLSRKKSFDSGKSILTALP